MADELDTTTILKTPAGARVGPDISRPRAYDDDAYAWNLRRVPHTYDLDGRNIHHPARQGAVFVVHGMGEQEWTQTAAGLRAGFENALDAIVQWQRTHPDGKTHATRRREMPPPFVFDGFWGDYANLKKTFPEDWEQFNNRERRFFSRLWRLRTISLIATFLWLLRQQVRILSPRVINDVGFFQWLLYWPLFVLWFGAFAYLAVRHPRTLTHVVGDVRLYASPKGIAERAIVQRIDRRVGEKFLQLLGLDWDFRQLPPERRLEAGGGPVTFEYVIWVAHSLGSVVSYNVLSDLFQRAAEVTAHGDDMQRIGATLFKQKLLRFVTLGSPLDKFAYLFPDAIRPWPTNVSRQTLLDSGEQPEPGRARKKLESREWWINFYHVLDPVSAPLSNKLICGGTPPFNFHASVGHFAALIPGIAHVAYWSDVKTLRFILGRVFGKQVLRDRTYVPYSPAQVKALVALGYVAWAAIVGAGLWVVVTRGPRLVASLLPSWLTS